MTLDELKSLLAECEREHKALTEEAIWSAEVPAWPPFYMPKVDREIRHIVAQVRDRDICEAILASLLKINPEAGFVMDERPAQADFGECYEIYEIYVRPNASIDLEIKIAANIAKSFLNRIVSCREYLETGDRLACWEHLENGAAVGQSKSGRWHIRPESARVKGLDGKFARADGAFPTRREAFQALGIKPTSPSKIAGVLYTSGIYKATFICAMLEVSEIDVVIDSRAVPKFDFGDLNRSHAFQFMFGDRFVSYVPHDTSTPRLIPPPSDASRWCVLYIFQTREQATAAIEEWQYEDPTWTVILLNDEVRQ